MVVPPLSDLPTLSHAQKDALIVSLWEQVASLTARLTALEQRLEPPKTPDNSSLPPSKGQKPNRADTSKPGGPRKASLGRKGGGSSLMAEPDQVVSAKAAGCRHCGTVLGEADHHLHSRYDKIELPRVRPMVTRVERYAGQCSCCERHDPGASSRGDGGGLALWPEHRRRGALPALHSRHQLPTPVPPVRAPVRSRHQRRRARRPVPPRQARLRRRHDGHPGPTAPVADRVLGRDKREDRWADLLELGFSGTSRW